MNPINLVADVYERKARLYPALLLVAPVVATALGVASAKLTMLESIATIATGCGGAFLLTQLARDAGKKCEKDLFEKWEGIPSVAVFRHRDNRIDPITKARYQKHLSGLVKGTKALSSKDEAADPLKADQIYTAWSNYLRTHTRDTKRHSLLFQENVSYGYRRNVHGLRALGVVVSTLSSIVGAVWLRHQHTVNGRVSEEAVGALTFAFVILLLWAFRFTSNWVRIPADAYAERLAESIDSISNEPLSSKGQTKIGTT